MGVKRYDRAVGGYVRVEPVSGSYLDDELPAVVADLSTADVDDVVSVAEHEERLAEIDALGRQDRKAFDDAVEWEAADMAEWAAAVRAEATDSTS